LAYPFSSHTEHPQKTLETTAVASGKEPTMAQDPVQVDPQRCTVEFENDQVRVLRIHYGPHEKSVMHGHPASGAVFLSRYRRAPHLHADS
jgi:uncharacterized protein (UPF0218 family)